MNKSKATKIISLTIKKNKVKDRTLYDFEKNIFFLSDIRLIYIPSTCRIMVYSCRFLGFFYRSLYIIFFKSMIFETKNSM